jgi:hypothetical protein
MCGASPNGRLGPVISFDRHERLYVKASGLAGGIRKETWLYEYDLKNRKQVRKQLVDPSVLSEDCSMETK